MGETLYTKHELTKAFTVYPDLDALIYDFSLDKGELDEDDIELCHRQAVDMLKETDNFVADYKGIILTYNGEVY